MRRRNGITLAVLIAIAIAVAVGHADAAEMRLTTENRTALAITVYGNGVALVSDERTAKVVAGLNRLAFEGVSREMIPSSAMLRTDASLRVLEMDYDFDLLTPQSLLQHAVGQTVEVVRTHPTSGEDSVEKAEVLSAENGIVLRYRDRIETGVPGRIVFEQLSNGLRALPTLVASVESIIAAERKLELSYLTGGLSWQADYTLTLNGDTANLDLTGRATLTNVSGINFRDAELGLIAGQVRRVTTDGPRPQPVAMRKAMAMAVAEDASVPARESLGDLHLYVPDRPVTIADRQTKQLALLSAPKVPYVIEYVSENTVAVYGPQRGDPRPQQAEVRLRFDNSEKDGPGQPLPGGVARLYQRDSRGALRLLGEDTVPHTPIGGTVRLSPGAAFDVGVTRRQTDFVRSGLPQGVFETGWRIEVKNAKPQAITARVVDVIPGDWEILSENRAHQKETADRAVWKLEVPARGSAEISYRVRVHQ